MEADEKILINLCKRGDLSAYDRLMQRYEKKVYALCFRMLGNPDDAADLAQEAFLKAFRALSSFNDQAQFSTWLYKIVTNACLDERRKRARQPQLYSLDKPLDTGTGQLALTLPSSGPDPLSITLTREIEAEINALLAMLPAEQRMVLVLRDLEGHSYEEISRILNLNGGTVKSRLSRARARKVPLFLKKEELFVPAVHLKGGGGISHDL